MLSKFQKLTLLVSFFYALLEFLYFIFIYLPAHEDVFLGVFSNIIILIVFMIMTVLMEVGILNLKEQSFKPRYSEFKGIIDAIGFSFLLIFLNVIILLFGVNFSYIQLILFIFLSGLMISAAISSLAAQYGDY
ncbi:MAG: hypothetical protein K9L02_05500 [Acholeplasmataceae bacterium]|nr:hypothetical protein [Acholeplasmataceae bacterium]